jgi:hypothetical protein
MPHILESIYASMYAAPCEQACLFCARGTGAVAKPSREADPQWNDLVALVQRVTSPSRTMFVIGGNEPLNHPRVHELIGLARDRAFAEIRMHTSGFSTFSEAAAHALRAAGLDSVDLPIYGPDAESHDAITRFPSSFDLVQRCADFMRAAGVRVTTHTVVLPQNVERLIAIREYALSKLCGVESNGEDCWGLWYPHPIATQLDAFEGVSVRISDIDASLRSRLTRRIPCLLSVEDRRRMFGEAPAPERRDRADSSEDTAFAMICGTCAWLGSCDGVHPRYLQIHGEAEFQPLTAAR